MDLQDAASRARHLIRDRDGKYPPLFDTILTYTEITVVLTGVQMPRMNAIMERWVQSCRHDCSGCWYRETVLPLCHRWSFR